MRFSQLDLDRQLRLIFDELTDLEGDSVGSLRVAKGALGPFNALVVGFDFSVQGGSIGAAEARQLAVGIKTAKRLGIPLLMMLNTGGVRVTEGANGLAAFRFVFRDLLDAKLDGLQVLSVVTRHCYGGGSMLATIGDRVLVNAHSQISMSGPKLIQALTEDTEDGHVSSDDIHHVLNGANRAGISSRFQLVEDDEQGYQCGIRSFFSFKQNLVASNLVILDELEHRFNDQGLTRSSLQVTKNSVHSLIDLTEIGEEASWSGSSAMFSLDNHADERVAIYALVADHFADAEAVFDLTHAINALSNSVVGIKVFIDCSSHSPKLSAERVLLSEYLAILAICMREKHVNGTHVHVILVGAAGGGIFAALSAAASEVTMLKTATVQILPPAAIDAMRWQDNDVITVTQLISARVVDNVIDDLSGVIS